MSATDHCIQPAEVPGDVLRRIDTMVGGRTRPTLVGSDGERIELPAALSDVLSYVVGAMKRNQAVFVVPDDAALTTQAAARLLGVSRPYLVRLLDAGAMPFHRVGTHRRVLASDLRAYAMARDAERRARLDRLAAAVDQAGVYDRH